MRRFLVALGLAPMLALAACSDNVVRAPESTGAGATGSGGGSATTGNGGSTGVGVPVEPAIAELRAPDQTSVHVTFNTDVAGLPGLEKMLQKNPDTTFIGHGPGWWASISGGISDAGLGAYPKGPVAPGGANTIVTRALASCSTTVAMVEKVSAQSSAYPNPAPADRSTWRRVRPRERASVPAPAVDDDGSMSSSVRPAQSMVR